MRDEPMRSGAVVIILLLTTGCASPSPAATPGATPQRLEPQPPVDGLPYDDPRLDAVLAELHAHPDWLEAPLDASPDVIALIPGLDELCLALAGRSQTAYLSIAPGHPWSVRSVAVEAGGGRRFTYDPEGRASDACRFVVHGRAERWPEDPGAIEVTGNVEAGEAAAIAAAVHERPDRFGIDAHGVPAVVVGDRIEPAPPGWRCAEAIVYVGGPRSKVVVGTRPAAGGWQVETRLLPGPISPGEPRPGAGCG